MATPDFILDLRAKIGTHPLWLSGITAVVKRDGGDLLLVRRADNGNWTPVTGIIDPGEEPAVAAEREVLEEADIRATVVRLASIQTTAEHVYPNGDRAQYIDFTFLCRYDGGEPAPADGENLEARWFSRDDLPAMPPEFAERLDAALSGEQAARFKR